MPYENIASKYRPGNLNEVMGQETIKQTLQNAVKLGRIANSYVFYGPRGCGKTTVARILAKTLNCHHPKDGVPCGVCPSCVEIAESKSLDVIEIDAASNTKVENVRDVIIENVEFSPSRDKYKVYILDEVHMLSDKAFNALLKTVEEPPAHVVFIMATTEQQKVPLTILSRSQCFRFRPISEAGIETRLKEVTAAEKIKTDPEALKCIARSAGGSMRDALTLLDRAASFGRGEVKTDVLNELLGHPGFEVVNSMALALVNLDAAALHAAFDNLNAEGHDPLTALRELRNNFAEAFLCAQGFSSASPIKGLPKDTPAGTLARLSRKINVIIEEVKFSDSLHIAAEIALFTLMETPQDLEGLVRRLEGAESRLAGGTQAAPVPAVPQKNDDTAAAPRPPAAAPVTAPGPAPAEAWKKLLGQVMSKKPALYNIMLSVRLVFSGDARWRLVSANQFETNMLEKSRPELEEMLERCAGKKISLSPECSQVPAAAAAAAMPIETGEIPGAEAEEEAVLEAEAALEVPPQGREPAARQVAVETEPELKHLAKVFHGRITRVNKIKQ